MSKRFHNRITTHIRRAKARLWRHRSVVTGLGVCVALVTLYLLIMPALTMDGTTADKTPGVNLSVTAGAQTEGEPGEKNASGDESGGSNKTDGAKDKADDAVTGDKVREKVSADKPQSEDESDGRRTLCVREDAYEITVEYGEEAKIPENASLKVSEIEEKDKSYDKYVEKSEDALKLEKGSISAIRLFDIKIVDDRDEKVEITAPVDVQIELKDKGTKKTEVVHFEDGKKKGDVIRDVDIEKTDKKKDKEKARKEIERTLTFEAPSFSVYAIVEAPEPSSGEITTITTLADLAAEAGKETEVYLSVKRNGSTNEYFTNTINNNSAFETTTKPLEAGGWYFESVDGSANTYLIYTYETGNNQKKYICGYDNNNIGLTTSASEATPFEIMDTPGDGSFHFKSLNLIDTKWLQYSGSGKGIRLHQDNKPGNQNNCRITIWIASSFQPPKDPYNLDGKRYGIAYHDAGSISAGLMTEPKTVGGQDRLSATEMHMKENVITHEGILLVAQDTDITEWTFESVGSDKYHIYTTIGGVKNYLTINGSSVTLQEAPDPVHSVIRAVPGAKSGSHAGQYQFVVGDRALNLQQKAANGFNAASVNTATTWLNLVTKTAVNESDFHRYIAKKVSVSDNTEVYDKVVDGERKQSQIILYTRVWNEDKKQYEVFVVDYDGTLIPCVDNGDEIEWTGSQINSALWEFTEYHYGDGTPNYYYELQNVQHSYYIAPQITNGQILSDSTIGINLNGRRNGETYTTIIAWDDPNYAYVALKTEGNKVVSCPLYEAQDFYFAVIDDYEDDPEDPSSHIPTTETIDNDLYGITMKMVDFNNGTTSGKDRDIEQDKFFGDNDFHTGLQGLLSTDLGEDGYPTGTDLAGPTGRGSSLANLFSDVKPANHLFLQSVYNESGYFEYDSTENFARYHEDTGKFTVYDRRGAISGHAESNTKSHGQFMPYDDLHEHDYATYANGKVITEQTDVLGNELSDTDPRKGEPLYNIGRLDEVDYFFGMELSAAFTQTESGKDAWGHDIIFDFSGDDDFWLYVDGELVLDLGGIHTAQVGTVNFRTGEISSTHGNATIKDTFYNNYKNRKKAAYIAGGDSEEEAETKASADAQSYVNDMFEQNEDGQYVFKDYTTHTMKIFYMERGAGSSNLRMRFNLAAVEKGTFVLDKKLAGAENTSNKLIKYPYQIWYQTDNDSVSDYHLLGENPGEENSVVFKGTPTPVEHAASFMPAGGTQAYQHVFFLKAGEAATVKMPAGTTNYYVVECAINPDLYEKVTADQQELIGTATVNMVGNTARKDYITPVASLGDRQIVEYVNHVKEGAMRTFSITKKLFDSDGETELHYPADPDAPQIDEDDTPFSFRLGIGDENVDPNSIPLANMVAYQVRNREGYYCKWVADKSRFEPLGSDAKYKDYSQLSDSEKRAATFNSSMNGSISKIPAEHTVEVRDLIVGTQFYVQERDYEIPKGYTLRQTDGYSRVDDGHEMTTRTTPITGAIESGTDPEVEVRNQLGWGLTMEKVWTDTDFMKSHDTIYFAVYLESGSEESPTYTRLDTVPVKSLTTSDSSVYFFFDNLQSGTPFEKYHIFEVTLDGGYAVDSNNKPKVDSNGNVIAATGQTLSVTRIPENGTLTNGGEPVGGSYHNNYQYTVRYTTGQPTGHNENVRTDTTTNSRPGIRLYKQDMSGQPLAGAEFTLKEVNGENVAKATYTSDGNGLITTAYLPAGTYTLTETKTPAGYIGITEPVIFTVTREEGQAGEEGTFLVNVDSGPMSGDEPLWILASDDPNYDHEDGLMYDAITVKNQPAEMLFRKVDSATEEPIENVHFALYRQVKNTQGQLVPNTKPVRGFEDIISDVNGVIPEMRIEDLQTKSDMTYYLRETEEAGDYNRLDQDICFTVSSTGVVTIIAPEEYQGWLTRAKNAETGKISYIVTIPNNKEKKISVWKTGSMYDTLTTGASFALYAAEDVGEDGVPIDGAAIVAEGSTGSNGILECGSLPDGHYKLIETTAPTGYVKLAMPVDIMLNANGVSARQAGNDALVVRSGQQYWIDDANEEGKVQDEDNWQIRVWNSSNEMLPASGGPGTRWMYVLGSLLILGAMAAFFVRRERIK